MHPHRIKISDLTVTDPRGIITNNVAYHLIDSVDGSTIATHAFPAHGNAEWYDAQRKVAQAIADALNAVPNAAIEYIKQCKREAHHIAEVLDRDGEKPR